MPRGLIVYTYGWKELSHMDLAAGEKLAAVIALSKTIVRLPQIRSDKHFSTEKLECSQ